MGVNLYLCVNMELRISKPSEVLRELYELSFPPEERRDWFRLPLDTPAFKLMAIVDEASGDEIGLITVWQFEGFSYVEHFAVNPNLRGAGLGSKVLEQLQGPVILEVEPVGSTPEAERRIRFYERNGFRVLDVHYVQPPYSPGLPELELRLMLRGDIADIDKAIKTIHKNVYNKV